MGYRLQTWPEGRDRTIDINDVKKPNFAEMSPMQLFSPVAIVYILHKIGPFLKSAHIYLEQQPSVPMGTKIILNGRLLETSQKRARNQRQATLLITLTDTCMYTIQLKLDGNCILIIRIIMQMLMHCQ